MGMASSQARLLMLTARLHDLEYQAQSIQNAKVQLSTQQDAVYEEYQKALDDATLTFTAIDTTSATKSTMVANFNNLFSINKAQQANGSHYLLIDSSGKVVVDDDVFEGYKNFLSKTDATNYPEGLPNNAYLFAMYMVEGERSTAEATSSNLEAAISAVFAEVTDMDTLYGNASAVIKTLNGTAPTDINNLLELTEKYYNQSGTNDDQRKVLSDFINYFWTHYGQKVFNTMADGAANLNNDVYKSSEFNYYVEIYNAIQKHGGCISIENFNGPSGSAATNSDWLTNMIQAGQLSIESIVIDKEGNANITGVSVAADSDLAYTAKTQVDKVAMAKAEAKYEYDMKLIDKKDQKYDLELSKLDTERTALTKEYDSIKKVASDNIERTFGIFS